MKKVKRLQKKCPRCSKKFIVGGRSGHITKIFCSKRCVLIGRPGRAYGWRKPELEPTKVPSKIDIAWAAGIYEGEGWCGAPFNMQGHKTQSTYIGQRDTWILFRLKALFGGSINSRKNYGGGSVPKGEYADQHIWHIHGSRAREFLSKIYPYMSPRRKSQIDKIT